MSKFQIACVITAINVLVAAGFAVAGLIKPEFVLPAGVIPTTAGHIFAMYSAARALPLAVVTLVIIFKKSPKPIFVLGVLACIIQFSDAVIGAIDNDVIKSAGPAYLGLLQIYACLILRKISA